MRYLFITLIIASLSFAANAETDSEALRSVITAHSPQNRVALLELYTSQGCSSCPPAESWLSSLKTSGISRQQLIPLAFHVTYWDYIGWRDRFASERYDQRQRNIVAFQSQRRIYTPQFVLSGNDYRRYEHFEQDLREIITQASPVDLSLRAEMPTANTNVVKLSAEIVPQTELANNKPVSLFLVLYENNLSSEVDAGENKGELLHHDYVVRQLHGPYRIDLQQGKVVLPQTLNIEAYANTNQLYLVAFAQDMDSGEILQAVQLSLADFD